MVQDISRCDGVLARIQLGKSYPTVGVYERLLVDTAYTLDIANVAGIL
jgi:hypothetical protein